MKHGRTSTTNIMRKLVGEGGCVQKNCTRLVGQTKRRVEAVAKKKARRSTDCTIPAEMITDTRYFVFELLFGGTPIRTVSGVFGIN